MATETIEPCPFCGNKAEALDLAGYEVVCSSCGAGGPIYFLNGSKIEKKEDAITEWNTRINNDKQLGS